MELNALRLQHLRNIRSAELEPASGINVLEGGNGAGKTSVLEAVSLISNGASFRTHRAQDLITRQQDLLRVVADFSIGDFKHRAGYERHRDGQRILRLDGEGAMRQSDIARLMPTLVIAPENFGIVSAGPSGRRKLIDWGLYHLAGDFHPVWGQYRRALSQRNTLLRKQAVPAELLPWSRELARWAEPLDQARKDYVAQLSAALPGVLSQLQGLPQITLTYRQGWREGAELLELLNAEATQRRKGSFSTQYGPHVAELEMLVDQVPARHYLSRGQQKLLVYGLKLAQLALFSAQRGQGCVVLCDDLPAELDPNMLTQVVELIRKSSGQAFVSTATPGAIINPNRVFHVEHGAVAQVL